MASNRCPVVQSIIQEAIAIRICCRHIVHRMYVYMSYCTSPKISKASSRSFDLPVECGEIECDRRRSAYGFRTRMRVPLLLPVYFETK